MGPAQDRPLIRTARPRLLTSSFSPQYSSGYGLTAMTLRWGSAFPGSDEAPRKDRDRSEAIRRPAQLWETYLQVGEWRTYEQWRSIAAGCRRSPAAGGT